MTGIEGFAYFAAIRLRPEFEVWVGAFCSPNFFRGNGTSLLTGNEN